MKRIVCLILTICGISAYEGKANAGQTNSEGYSKWVKALKTEELKAQRLSLRLHELPLGTDSQEKKASDSFNRVVAFVRNSAGNIVALDNRENCIHFLSRDGVYIKKV